MCGKKDFFSLQRQKRKETDTDVVRKLENSQRKLEQTMKRLLFNVFDQVLDALPQGIRESQFSVRVVIAGCTGVGKSSTANALLGTNWKVGHVRATTREIEAKQLVLVEDGVETPSNIEVIDVPGLGESIARDREYIPIYVELLKTCDAMIWLQSANERQMTSTQIYLNKLVTALPDLASRTVIGLNKLSRWDGALPRVCRTKVRKGIFIIASMMFLDIFKLPNRFAKFHRKGSLPFRQSTVGVYGVLFPHSMTR
jgi:tRNA U34 5-carboxymethylaminomethyl modifying GTPase MnmE/TrmE